MRHTNGKKRMARHEPRRASRSEPMNLPRTFLFMELFVDKDIPHRSTK
jgi:hypothetical protein